MVVTDGWPPTFLVKKGSDVHVVTPVDPDEIPSALARHVARRTAGRDVSVHVGLRVMSSLSLLSNLTL